MKKLVLTLTGLLCLFAVSFAQLSVNITHTNPTCFGFSNGTATATPTGGTAPYTYLWTPNNITTATATGLLAGTYSVTVTDASSASVSGSVVITQPPQLLVAATGTSSSCNNSGTAFATATGGAAPYTFSWSNGATSSQIGNLSAGLYWLTVIDANGCGATDSVWISGGTSTLPLTVALVYDTCAGSACAIASSSVNARFFWSNGDTSSQICGLPNGVYSITATDNFGCSAAQSVTVINQTLVQAAATSTSASCGNDGSVIATATGGALPYSYLWNNNATTPLVNNLPAGNYTVLVTDANGCSTTASTTIASGSFSLDSTSILNASCQSANNGAAAIFVSGSNPPFQYTWSNGGPNTNILSGVAPGVYVVTVTDNGGCVLVQTFVVSAQTLQLNIDHTSANCQNTGGTLEAIPLNGTAPYDYDWSNGATTSLISGLSTGGYTVTVTDANGCVGLRHHILTVEANCFTRVSGKVYLDLDNDCALTTNDLGINNVMVKVEPGYFAYTNAQGNWSTWVRVGNYRVSTSPLGAGNNLQTTCGIDTLLVNVNDTIPFDSIDIPKTTTVLNNVSIGINCGVARPGFSQTTTVTIHNLGFNAASGSGSVILDGVFNTATIGYLAPGITIDSITTQPTTVHFSYTNLAPQQQYYFQILSTVPTIPTVSLGQVLAASGTVVLDGTTDQDLDNNTYTCTAVIVGSYDPNDKQVFDAQGSSIDGPAAVEDTLLHYLIRFQNTGTDTAFNIVVRDTLDSDLNVSSFRFIAASHDVVIEFYEERIVHFVFNNILLPDSNVNEPGSHGFIEFDIEVLDKEALEEVTNQAAIYFDFNPPIYTNTVATQRTVGIAEKAAVSVNVFPNPTTGLLSVNLGGLPVEQVELFDLMGRKVLAADHASVLQADVNATNLESGLYIVRIRSGAHWHQHKVVVANK